MVESQLLMVQKYLIHIGAKIFGQWNFWDTKQTIILGNNHEMLGNI